MSVKKIVALACMAFAGSAMAQAALGTVSNVNGVVTVTDGAKGGTVANGSPINNGMRFVTTSSGSATLRLNSGCTVTLQPNQAVTVMQSMTCQQLTAAVQPIGGNPAYAGAGGVGTAMPAAIIGLGGVGLARSNNGSSSLSAN